LKWLKLSLVCGFIFFIWGCRAENKSLPSDVVAKIDNEMITIEQFKREMARRPGQFATPEHKGNLLEQMIRSDVLYTAAQKAGYDKDPEVLAIQKRMVANKFRKDHLDPQIDHITITDEDVEQYYMEHQDDFKIPSMVQSAIIQISVPSGASEEKKAQFFQRAEIAWSEALALDPETRSFGSVAVKYSDDQSTRYKGGDIDWLRIGDTSYRWEQEVMDTIFNLSQPGEVSPIITTPSGFYILKCMEVKDSGPRPLEQLKEYIRYQILEQKKARIEAEFYEKLKRKIPVEINNGLLSAIEPLDEEKKDKTQSPPALPRG